ncbi:hypothetical protein [Sphingomonas endolithica]|uniref:hypothetical protein n=1 Tax=Sphingomonas endolithica TaxID=2972485 RepID=UPI0021AF409E|nr:hypothetical protein [Sphingomonas sp. ZFBP2030]
MSKNTNAAPRGTQSNRPNASRALLLRKAVEKLGNPAPFGESIEDSFPVAEFTGPMVPAVLPAAADHANGEPAPDAAPNVEYIESKAPAEAPQDQQLAAVGEPSSDAAHAAVVQLPVAPAWSEQDEALLQALTARRKASGFQRRSKDVSGQMLRVGEVTPNPGTVVAAIVALVTERRAMRRGELLDAMAAATFPHPRARPQDRS